MRGSLPLRLLGVLCLILVARPATAQNVCASDCSDDGEVSLGEVQVAFRIFLGVELPETCVAADTDPDGEVALGEVQTGFRNFLSGCAVFLATVGGTCRIPGPAGLVDCPTGTAISVSQCIDQGRCIANGPGARSRAAAATVASGGAFSARLRLDLADTGYLLVEAQVDPPNAVVYRALVPVEGSLDAIAVGPLSEATVRLLDTEGLQNFPSVAFSEIDAAVGTANGTTDFSGMAAADAAISAATTASADPAVMLAIQANRRTPTPTRTPTPSSTATPSRTPTPSATPAGTRRILFEETWESGRIGLYKADPRLPFGGDIFRGSTGDWFVGDTHTQCAECGPTPHFAEIIDEGGNRRLRLSSMQNDCCADNLFVGSVMLDPPGPRVLPFRFTPDVLLSFFESGRIESEDECAAVFVNVALSGPASVASLDYVLERGPGWDEGGCTTIVHSTVFLLPPGQGFYRRNVIADLESVTGASLSFERVQLSLEVQSGAVAVFDDIRFLTFAEPEDTPTPTPTPRGDNCISVQQGNWCFLFGEVFGAEGRLRQSGCTLSFDNDLVGPLTGNRWDVFASTPQGDVDLTCFFSGSPADSCNGTVDVAGTVVDVTGEAGACPDDECEDDECFED